MRSPPRKPSDVTARATAVRDFLTEIFEAAPTLGGDANGDLGYVSVRRTVDRVSKHVIERTPSSCQAALADADRLLEQMRRSGTTQGAWQEDGCPGT